MKETNQDMKNKELHVTIYVAIENSDGSIQLSDLMRPDGTLYNDASLHFKELENQFWDDSEYVSKFLRGLKNNKKKQNAELKEFCIENKMDFTITKENLIDIYKQAKRLRWFTSTKK